MGGFLLPKISIHKLMADKKKPPIWGVFIIQLKKVKG